MHDRSAKSGRVIYGGGSRDAGVEEITGVIVPGATEEPAALVEAPEGILLDPAVRALVRQISSRLFLPKPRLDIGATRGFGELATVPYRGVSDEIDLDATTFSLAEHPVPEDRDIFVRERLRTRRSVVLLVDVSGSMRGERIGVAAATVGALSAELAHDALALVAFWSDAAILSRFADPIRPLQLTESLLRIPARGLTNVAFPLYTAGELLREVIEPFSRALLLSDCVHNAGPDPRAFAARLPRLDILLDASGEKDVDLGRQLASKGKGTCHIVRSYRDVAPALSKIFAH